MYQVWKIQIAGSYSKLVKSTDNLYLILRFIRGILSCFLTPDTSESGSRGHPTEQEGNRLTQTGSRSGCFGLYLISPLLNKAVDSCSKEQLLFIVVIFTILNAVTGFFFSTGGAIGINGGYSLMSFVHIYLLGQFIARYVRYQTFQQWSAVIYIFSSILLFLIVFISITRFQGDGIIRLFSYNNPLVIISAVSFFFVFKSFRLQSGLVNQTATGVLGVYLLHDHRLVRKHVIDRLFDWSQNYSGYQHFLVLLLITVLVFVTCLLIDKVRELLLAPVANYLVNHFKLQQVDHIFTKEPARKINR
jgi:surface polysaccharide O-acyltransferase-like enzyme